VLAERHREDAVSSDAYREYERFLNVLRTGAAPDLDALEHQIESFPGGTDGFLGRRWIINAVDVGSRLSVEWMIGRHVDLNFCDEEGRTPVIAALGRSKADRYELLELLLAGGAPVNLKGQNDWTPAHWAAAGDDVEALRILVGHGADLSVRTTIDSYATPLEEARALGKKNAVAYLKSVG